MTDYDEENTSCRRCGTCCEKGGPALHGEDRRLVADGVLALRDLVAIRIGEPALDQAVGGVAPAGREFLKLRGGAGSWCCLFYDREQRGCGIYRHRPLECRLLSCRNTTPLEQVMWRDLLQRRDLLEPDDPVLQLLNGQDREIVYAEVQELLGRLNDPRAAVAAHTRLAELSRRDLALRQVFLRHFPQREAEELFLFGRPLFLVLSPYGLRLRPA